MHVSTDAIARGTRAKTMCVDPKHKSWTPRELAKAPPERVLIAIDGRVHDCAGWLHGIRAGRGC